MTEIPPPGTTRFLDHLVSEMARSCAPPAESPPEPAPDRFTPSAELTGHGSTAEQRLLVGLEEAKVQGDPGRVRQARADLHRYWRSLIAEESASLPREALPARLEEVRHDPADDPFAEFRLHSLARRARELGDPATVAAVERVRQRRGCAPTGWGRRLAKVAEGRCVEAPGDGASCFRGVALTLDEVGVHLYGRHAYLAADQMARQPRFREIRGLSAEQLATLPPGAIVVWDRGPGQPSGHVSIALGDGREASDVLRPQVTTYGTACRVFLPRP